MKIRDLCNLVNGTVLCGEQHLDSVVEYAFASDLMSDVLTVKTSEFILITGLANLQAIRTAEMSDTPFLLICRGKEVSEEMLDLASDNEILIISSSFSMFKCAGVLYSAGLKPIY
ncbi:MAG: DRTGG domain-containing protein [Bacteroidales bacterium]|jgi:predicted transcriptional regulator|nr:DRTGG domain-containing protein [Bacteroidales bacterium]MDD4058239.1 DRTGG domain-containing protein [Bacteroidales bacterium]